VNAGEGGEQGLLKEESEGGCGSSTVCDARVRAQKSYALQLRGVFTPAF